MTVITDDMVATWKVNYGLDTRGPAEAMKWWADAMDGKAPAGAVAALGLLLEERERHADAMRCALDALDYCIEDSAELLSERTAQWGQHRQDRQAAMAATLERHRAVAERLRALLMAQRRG